jgi:hypothetical protein
VPSFSSLPVPSEFSDGLSLCHPVLEIDHIELSLTPWSSIVLWRTWGHAHRFWQLAFHSCRKCRHHRLCCFDAMTSSQLGYPSFYSLLTLAISCVSKVGAVRNQFYVLWTRASDSKSVKKIHLGTNFQCYSKCQSSLVLELSMHR